MPSYYIMPSYLRSTPTQRLRHCWHIYGASLALTAFASWPYPSLDGWHASAPPEAIQSQLTSVLFGAWPGVPPTTGQWPFVVLRVTIISYVSINSGGALYRYQEDTDGVLRPLYWGELAPHKCSSRVTKETRVITGNVSKLALKQRKEVNRFRKPARLGQRPHACRAVAWEQRVDDCLVHSVPVKECNASSILRTSAQKKAEVACCRLERTHVGVWWGRGQSCQDVPSVLVEWRRHHQVDGWFCRDILKVINHGFVIDRKLVVQRPVRYCYLYHKRRPPNPPVNR